MQLIGEYTVALDEKGRLRVPTALLRQLGEKPDGEGYEFVINRGFEKCMTLYPKSVWDAIAEKLSRLNRFNQTNRAFIRSFYLGAYPVTTDSADRILLQKPSMDYAQIAKEAVLVAMDDRIEIWSPELYASVASIESDNFADLANMVMGGGADGVGDMDFTEF
jgi:MraZ protein